MYDMRHTVFTDETIDIELEYVSLVDMYFIHVDCHYWSKDAYLHHLRVTNWLGQMLRDQGLTKLYALRENDKLAKYASMFGFKESDVEITSNTGLRLELLEWTL